MESWTFPLPREADAQGQSNQVCWYSNIIVKYLIGCVSCQQVNLGVNIAATMQYIMKTLKTHDAQWKKL